MISAYLLRNLELFNGLSDHEIALIAQVSRNEQFSSGQMLFKEGEPAVKIYALIEGEVEILKHDAGNVIIVDRVVPGKIFGWSALTEPAVLTASARTVKPTKLIVTDNNKLKCLFEKNPRMGYVVMSNLTRVISQRLSHFSKKLLEQNKKGGEKE